MNQEEFKAALATWLEGAQAIINREMERHYPNGEVPKLTVKQGKRYIRIVKESYGSRSAHTFIDLTTGDVLKPASWAMPAKHARGNIFDESNGLSCMQWTGPAYLR